VKNLLNGLSNQIQVAPQGLAPNSGISITGAQGSQSPWSGSIIGGSGAVFQATGNGSASWTISDLNSAPEALVKKYEIYESKEDLLALSVCWKRLRDSGQSLGIGELLNKRLFSEVSTEDRDKANEIRDYYSKKIMVLKLKSVTLTNFREDLNTFIHSDGLKFKENMMPLAYRLPEFYEYDKTFETIACEYNRTVVGYKERASNPVCHLSFVGKLNVNTKRFKRVEYWFHDNNNNLVNISFDPNNTLLSLLDKSLTETLTVSGHFYKKERDGQEFLKIDKYKFV